VEQSTFALSLWLNIRHDYDILHVQDPWLALVLDRLHGVGLSRPKVILGHGTEEEPWFLRKLSNLQHLTPLYDEEWQKYRPTGQFSIGIPNFIDTNRFCPGDKQRARLEWNIPSEALVVLSVAALNKSYKRCDYVIHEFADFHRTCPRAILILAGARDSETDEVTALAASIGQNAVRVFTSLERDRVPSLYQAADVFVLGSLWEMMPIAVLEALASGLPVVCNNTPTLQWMVGEAGYPTNLRVPAALCDKLQLFNCGEARNPRESGSRERVMELFSERKVVSQILRMYEAVNAAPRSSGRRDIVHKSA
jgi:glycosyltransferase involved in cell wall biosynthesis